MTTDTAGVLTAIDGALRDWQTSADAMRWAPARLPRLNRDQKAIARRLCAQTGVDGYAATFMILDVAGRNRDSPYWDEVSAAARGMMPEVAQLLDADWQSLAAQVQAAIRAYTDALTPAFSQMAAAFQALGKAFSGPLQLKPGVNVTCWDCGGNWRRARCTTCHPLAFPGPILGRKPSARRVRGKRRSR